MTIWAEKAQKTQQKPMRMKNWNGSRMPKEMKRVENAQKNEMGQRSTKQHDYQPYDNARVLELNKRKAYSKPKRNPASTS